MVLSPVVRRIRRFECQGVDDSCRNFSFIPEKTAAHTQLIIYTTFLVIIVECLYSAEMVVHLVYSLKSTGSILKEAIFCFSQTFF